MPSRRASSALCVYLVIFFFVTGARETDYPPCDEAAPNAEAAQAATGSSQSSDTKSAGGDAVLGGITVVGCEADGIAAVPQTASSQDDTGQWLFPPHINNMACWTQAPTAGQL